MAEYVVFAIKVEEEGDVWVGTCLELGTSTFADTLDECLDEIESLVGDHLNTLEALGKRERFFQTHGIQVHYDEAPTEYSINGHFSQLVAGSLLKPQVFPARPIASDLVEA